MKKSILSSIIVCGMLVSAVGCSDKSDSKSDDKSSESKAEATTAADDDETGDNEKSDASDTKKSDGKIMINGVSGKKVSELNNEGFEINGYMSSDDKVILYLVNEDYKDDEMDVLLDSLKGKTVKELVDEYDISISHFGFDDEYTFSSEIGTVTFSYDIEHGVEAINNHADESFFDLEEAEEVQSDVLENIEISNVSFELTLDEASNQKLLDAEELDSDYANSIADELIVDEVYYKIK